MTDPKNPAFTSAPPHPVGREPHSWAGASSARGRYREALAVLDQEAPPATVAAMLLQIARTQADAQNDTGAAECIEAILTMPTSEAMEPVVAEALELRGRLFCATGDIADAESDFRDLKHRAATLGDDTLKAQADEQLASVAFVRGDWHEAVTLLESAADHWRAVGDDAAVLRALGQLVSLHVDLKRWNAAEQAFADAVPRAQRLGDTMALARLELARARMSIDRGNVERSRTSAERALDLARASDDREVLARAILAIGVVTREQGDVQRASRLFEDAERSADALNDPVLLAEIAIERADALSRQGEHRVTLRMLNRGYRAFARLQSLPGTAETARQLRRIETGFLDVVRRWGQRIESKDHETSGHVDRVGDVTVEIARRMGIAPAELFWYRVGAYLHDLGKTEIPSHILNKPGRLTADEWAVIKRHPGVGADLLAGADFPWEVRPIVESHHECWDGSGYPHGLAGEEIPLAARMFTVADVYDALTSRRSFKQGLSSDEAVEAMRRDVGRQFDPAVFRVFEDVIRDGIAMPGVTSNEATARVPHAEIRVVDDPLTGVSDDTSWRRLAAAALASSLSESSSTILLLVDIDHFTRLNETYGRLQGDDVLWAVAKVLQRGLRNGDLIGRRGADEFAILLPRTSLDEGLEVSERLRDTVAGLRCARRDTEDESVSVSASIAVATSPQDGDTIESLLASADRALFRARRDGRDRVVVADQTDTAHARASLDFSTFVGREVELRSLIAQLDAAARGEPRFVSVGGEAGIGKTALLDQLNAEARLRQGTLIAASGRPAGENGPWSFWADIIAQLNDKGLVEARAWRALPLLVPALGSVSPAEAPPPALVQQEVLAVIKRAAKSQLLILVIDDAHLADPASWALLDALINAVDDEPLLVCYAFRPDEARAASEWRRKLSQHPRSLHIALQRFTLEDIRRWIRAVFHDASPGDDVSRFVEEYAEGIPRQVLDVLRACCEDGTIWYGGTRWEWRPIDPHALPAGIGAVLERRLDRLTQRARTLMPVASVLSGSLSLDVVMAATGLSESDARSLLDEGVSAAILRHDGEGSAAQYVFRHELLAEICLRTVPERQRQQLHDMAARVLELRSPSQVEAISAHYHASGNDESAFSYARRFAERAVSRYAHDSAFAALQVAQRYAPTSTALADLRLRHAYMAIDAGRYDAAEAQCDLAMEWLERSSGDPRTRSARRLREWLAFRRGKPSTRSLNVLLREVDNADSELDSSAAALCAADIALTRADWSDAAALANRAISSVELQVSADLASRSWVIEAVAAHGEGNDQATRLAQEVLERRRAARDAWGSARAQLTVGDLMLRGAVDHSRVDAALVGALEQARDTHNASVAAAASRSLGELRAQQGRFDEAMQWLGDAERLFAAIADDPEHLRTQLSTALAARDGGDRAQAHARFESVAAAARGLDIVWIELVANAGAAMSNGGPGSDSARARWARISDLVSDRETTWWFPARETIDAFAIHMALAEGHTSLAADLFDQAGERLAPRDTFGSAWLVASCAPELEGAGFGHAAAARTATIARARTMGYAPLLPQLSR